MTLINVQYVIKRYLSTELKTSKSWNSINKILIANRGEIACRVIKTARRLGIKTVAVYSEADKNSLHVASADEAYNIGQAASQLSYLRGEKILEIAKKSGCQAIHPGYGFLSENVEFAEQCDKNDLIFIGPPSSAIRDMGIKSTSKHIMEAAGVPIINGYHGNDQTDKKLIEEADKIGYPLMIKAVRGGGGKGMRIANSKKEFLSLLESARSESQKSFGDSSVLLERYVRTPRHVEVQVFADRYGNAVYLFERDCSVQRRHQKIIEEAPAPGISDELRKELGEAAVRAAKAVGYVGAGTVEFILNKEDLSFHFMEMNTRLQVEHPITEMITKTDLVEWQIRVAAGEPVPLTQDKIIRQGHAFEARIYAENPRNGFLPGAGLLEYLKTPNPNENVRIETGVRQGDEVSVHYDPMIAKLVVWGENRSLALNSLISRLTDYQICGLDTNVNFLIDLARHPSFQAGDVHTGFIAQHADSLFPHNQCNNFTVIQSAMAQILFENKQTKELNKYNPFFLETNFRLNHFIVRVLKMKFDNEPYTVEVKTVDDGYNVRINESEWKSVTMNFDGDKIIVYVNGTMLKCNAKVTPYNISIFNEHGKHEFSIEQPKFLLEQSEGLTESDSNVASPMPGVLEKLLVKPGDTVQMGDPVAVITAMKMEHVLKAPRSGVVKSVGGNSGDNMGKGAAIVTLEDDKENQF